MTARSWLSLSLCLACRPAATPVASPPAAAEPAAEPTQTEASEPWMPAMPQQAIATASGLHYVKRAGGAAGEPPSLADSVRVHYRLWNAAGELIDSSPTEAPATLEMERLAPGWAEGLALLVPGDRATLWVPASGNHVAEGRAAGALVVEVVLVDIVRGTGSGAVGLGIATPPADAERLPSGLVRKVLRPGTGTAHPGPKDRITAHYAGWTADGKPFDSSYERGQPIDFLPEQVIPGWTEAIALMVEGEKCRVWIPEALAYKGKPGRPAGLLIFDIELVRFARAK